MLQMAAEELKGYTSENIEALLHRVLPVLEHRQELYARYARKKGPDQTMEGSHPGDRMTVPFEHYIVHMVQGYLGGKAPMYSVRSKGNEQYAKRFTEAIEHIRRYNDDGSTYIELIHDYLTTSAAYLYLYENEDNEVVYTRFDSRQTVAVFDYATPPNQIGCVRAWRQTDADGGPMMVVEVITDECRTQYIGGSSPYRVMEKEPLAWGDLPCVAFEHTDGMAIFEPALSAIATYEQLIGNIRSMTQYNDDAKLLVVGYQPEEPAFIYNDEGNIMENPARQESDARWLKAPVLYVPIDGKIGWLLKNVDYTGTLQVAKSLHDLITMLTGVPNMTDEAFSSADNASALGYKLYALDQYSAPADRVFRKGYLRLWEVITGRLNLKGARYDFRDIDITLQRNLPTDRDKSIARAAQMKQSGLFSDETCINESQVEVNADEEMARRQREEQADYDRMRTRSEEMTDDGGQGASASLDANRSEGRKTSSRAQADG